MQKFEYEKPLIEIYLRPADEDDILDLPGKDSPGSDPGDAPSDGNW